MRLLVIALPVCAVLAACIPVEVQRNQEGALAYRLEKGIAVLGPAAKSPKRFDIALEGEEKCEPIWLAWAPDGRRLAFTCALGEDRQALCLLDTGSAKVRHLATHEGMLYFPRWSPEGDQVSYVVNRKLEGEGPDGHRNELRLVNLASGAGRVLTDGCGLMHAWAPDGASIATTRARTERLDDEGVMLGSLVMIEVASGQREELAALLFWQMHQLRFGADGRIYFCAPRVRLPHVLSPATPQPESGLFAFDVAARTLTLLTGKGDNVTYSAASPNGKRMLFISSDPGELLEGTVYVTGDGFERKRIGRNESDLFPFWMDEDTVGILKKDGEEARLMLVNVNKPGAVDATARFKGMELDD